MIKQTNAGVGITVSLIICPRIKNIWVGVHKVLRVGRLSVARYLKE